MLYSSCFEILAYCTTSVILFVLYITKNFCAKSCQEYLPNMGQKAFYWFLLSIVAKAIELDTHQVKVPLRGFRYRHFLKCRHLRNDKTLPVHPTSPRGHQKMRQVLPHLSAPFTKREIEAKYFILSPLSVALASILSFLVLYCTKFCSDFVWHRSIR